MKVALVSADSFALWHHCGGLIRTLVQRGDDVDVMSPQGPWDHQIQALGARRIMVPFNRFISPVADLRLCATMLACFRRQRPDLVHTFQPKANLWGALSARAARVPRLVLCVSGLGFAFADTASSKAKALRPVLRTLYRVAFACADRVWFENPDDLQVMTRSTRLPSHKAIVIRSQGVNTDDYLLSRLDPGRVASVRNELSGSGHGKLLITMAVARLIWSKGVAEFVGAAEQLSGRLSGVQFVLVGPTESANPEDVSDAWLESKCAVPNFKWFNFRQDIREVIAASDAVVLPSYYGEGVPRILLEAMALERPIITTDNVGCREVIRHNVNGIQVPMRSAAALANAVEALASMSPTARRTMGREGRKLVEAEFSEKIVVKRVLSELYGIGEKQDSLRS